MHRTIRTATLDIAFEAYGPDAGPPLILLHGFPDDPRAWDDVVPPFAESGWRVLVPWLRGYGPTRFLQADTPRSGQQAALGADLLDFMDGLGIARATFAGYDWGGRAACIVAALWPDRVRALLSITGYNIQDIEAASRPASAEQELRLWYQWYFHTERGRAGLAANRHDICRLLWRLWSPNWRFDDATYCRTAPSFDNPDFVDVVIQSYRHRYANAPGDPALEPIEQRLAAQPRIGVPTVNLHGAADGVTPAEGSEGHARQFSAFYQRRVVPTAGHFLPREAPDAIIEAIRVLEKELVP